MNFPDYGDYNEAHERATWGLRQMEKGDGALLDRSLALLHRFATEQTGWRGFFRRWYYSDEPLRNDAANLVRAAGFGMPMPRGTHLVGDQED